MCPFDAGVQLSLVPLKSDVPPEVRFRKLLKYALRTCLWRCVSIRSLSDEPPH